MPCFMREKSLLFRPRRDTTNDRDVMAPKAVRPRSMRYHGLFGMSIASQHLIVDNKWTPSSLVEQYKGFTELLSRRIIYKRHETRANRKRLREESKRLKIQCSDGRLKLQKISFGSNSHKIRNFLSNHRDMQRLYQKMPIHLVVDNINQRTFILRKERDRLEFRLSQVKHEYRELLLDRSETDNRIKYQNEFVLEEELISRILLKKIENSDVRLKAIKTINTTYKKMVQVLLQDEIFYEPILRSLDGDMEEQSNFIKHILYLGMPVIAKFKDLNYEFRMLEEKSRKNLQSKILLTSLLKNKPAAAPAVPAPPVKDKQPGSTDLRRYVRETHSMAALKVQLQSVEKTIKELKLVTLCSQAKEIYRNVKNQMEKNEKLRRRVEFAKLSHNMFETKMKCTTMLEDVLINNLSEEEINRLQRISDLKKILKADEEFEQETMAQIKNRADAYVSFRMCLWNIVDILRHVDHQPKTFRSHYPNSYLKLPLLKFEMLLMHASAPDIYEEDIEKLMLAIKRKVYKLMKGYKPEMQIGIKRCKEEYQHEFLANFNKNETVDDDEQQGKVEDDLLQSNKMTNVPNRKQIKAQSARLIEMAIKKDE